MIVRMKTFNKMTAGQNISADEDRNVNVNKDLTNAVLECDDEEKSTHDDICADFSCVVHSNAVGSTAGQGCLGDSSNTIHSNTTSGSKNCHSIIFIESTNSEHDNNCRNDDHLKRRINSNRTNIINHTTDIDKYFCNTMIKKKNYKICKRREKSVKIVSDTLNE